MKKIGIILILSVILVSFKGISSKKIIGHWTTNVDLYDLKVNDTLIFTKIKYTEKIYQWAGALAGIELAPNKSFSEYHNVMCSTESNPIRYNDEKWILHNDLITIIGSKRETKWRIMNMTSKRMTVVVLKINKNE